MVFRRAAIPDKGRTHFFKEEKEVQFVTQFATLIIVCNAFHKFTNRIDDVCVGWVCREMECLDESLSF